MTYTYKELDPGIAFFLEEGAKAGNPPSHTLRCRDSGGSGPILVFANGIDRFLESSVIE